ncbi:MAG: hypothetical protein ACLFQP_07875, partial [Halothece sp.]
MVDVSISASPTLFIDEAIDQGTTSTVITFELSEEPPEGGLRVPITLSLDSGETRPLARFSREALVNTDALDDPDEQNTNEEFVDGLVIEEIEEFESLSEAQEFNEGPLDSITPIISSQTATLELLVNDGFVSEIEEVDQEGINFTIEETDQVEVDADSGSTTVEILPAPQITDPIIGFDESRVGEDTSGFFLENGTPFNLIDQEEDFEGILADASAPEIETDVEAGTATLSNIDLLLSPEFAEFLDNEELAGTDIGDVRIDAQLQPDGNNFSVVGGTTSVSLSSVALETLGLELLENNTPDDPAEGFDFGFSITDETPLTLDEDLNPVDGDVNHEGEVLFNAASEEVEEPEAPTVGFDIEPDSLNEEDGGELSLNFTVDG